MESYVYCIVDRILKDVIYIGSSRNVSARIQQYLYLPNRRHAVNRYMRAWPDWKTRFQFIGLLKYSSYTLAHQAEMTLIFEKTPWCNIFVPKQVYGVPNDPTITPHPTITPDSTDPLNIN